MTKNTNKISVVTGFSVTTIQAAAEAAARKKEETRRTLAGLKPALVREDTVLPCTKCGVPRRAEKMMSRGWLQLFGEKKRIAGDDALLEARDVIRNIRCSACVEGRHQGYHFLAVLSAVRQDELGREVALRARKDAERKKASGRQQAALRRRDPAEAVNRLHRKAEAAARQRVALEEQAKAQRGFAKLAEDLTL